MGEVSTISIPMLLQVTAGSNLMVATLAAIIIWGISRLMDIAAGINFRKEVIPEILSGNVSASLYYGLRFMGLCTTFGFLLSRTPI